VSLTPPVSARDHAIGPATAPVTLVEYGDYECPYCGAAYPVVKELQRHFRARLRFVFRNFPLSQIHPHAEHAAEAAEAAGEAGKFWEMHDTLYEHQRALADPDLLRYAAAVGVDPGIVAEALIAQTYRERVRSDFTSGVRSGVNGTPSFFINGEKYDGSYDAGALRKAIDAAS
jgi:protein-disulfide isomerase